MDDDRQQSNNEVSLESLQQDLEQTVSAWKRTAADFENYKRRAEQQQSELVEFARQAAVVKLLPALDALGVGLKNIPELPSDPTQEKEQESLFKEFGNKYLSWQSGIKGILQQLDKALFELGIEKIKAVGKAFDPHFHEAVKEQESDKPEGEVLEELQTGYTLNGKLLRPSQVVISKLKITNNK